MKPARTGGCAKVSAYVMGAMWLAYGVMHFVSHDEAVRQMPTYFPWKSFWVSITGLGELAVGLGLFWPATRRYAAWGSIGLLVIFTPAVINIVVNDVVPVEWPSWLRVFFRWFVPPHNVLVALWAFWLTGDRFRGNGGAGSRVGPHGA